MKRIGMTLACLLVWVFAVPMGWAQKSDDTAHAELAKALRDAKISLQRGLAASTKEGKPISAKYEVEHGKLQLSVYTMKGDKFSEVIVDHKTGKVAKAEPITGGDDLTRRARWRRPSQSPAATISRRRRRRAKRWPRRSGPSMRRRPRP